MFYADTNQIDINYFQPNKHTQRYILIYLQDYLIEEGKKHTIRNILLSTDLTQGCKAK